VRISAAGRTSTIGTGGATSTRVTLAQ
jgi:hypothetical protein